MNSSALSSAALLLSAIICTGVPWLWDFLLPLKIAGTSLAFYLVTRTGRLSTLWLTWLWCSCSIAIAFHWSPAAMAYSLSSSYWLGLLVSIPLILWDGMRLALGFWLASKITTDLRWIWLPSVAITVLLESTIPCVFPWKAGLPYLNAPWMIQGIDAFGSSWTTVIDYLVAGCILSVGCTIVSCYKANLWLPARFLTATLTLPLLVLAFNALYGVLTWNHWSEVIVRAPHLKIGMVQVDPGFQESLGDMQDFSYGLKDEVDLVCWPESSGGTLDISLNTLEDKETTYLQSKHPLKGIRPWPNPHCELLVGGKNYFKKSDSDREYLHVTAMLISDSEQITGRYHKRHLMPFGEYVPLGKWIPPLNQLFDMQDEIEPGESPMVLDSRCGAVIGTFLCYEDMIPEAAVELIHCNANLLVSLINGSAFESPFTLRQHRLLSQARAIETRRYFVRCAATGETCIVSPLGLITSKLPMLERGVLVGDIALLNGVTIFAKYPRLLFIGSGLILLATLYASRRSSRVISS
ncbi:MAG: Apolipoprotein N-acyltransferase [Planctomycetota bacterium]